MLKSITFLFLLLSISLTSVAQMNIEWGNSLESDTKMSKIIGEDADGNVYALAYKGKKFFFNKYDKSGLSEKLSKEIVLPEVDGKDQDLAQIYFTNDQFVILGSQYNNKTEHLKITAYNCSFSGIMEKNGRVIMDVSAPTRSKAGIVWYRQSPDNSKILLANVSYDKEANNYIEIKIFDQTLNMVNSYKETVKGVFKDGMVKVSVSNFILNNSGRAYYAWERMYYKSKGIDLGDNMNNDRDYSIMEIDETGKQREIPIALKNLKVAQMSFITDKDNNLQIGGLYYQQASKGLIKGIYVRGSFYVKLNGVTGKKMAETSQAFDKKMMLDFRSEKQLSKGQYLDNHFMLKSVYEKPDGSLMLVAEYFRVTESSSSTGPFTTYYYTYGDLIVININAKGEIDWTRSVTKTQIYKEQVLNIGAFFGGMIYLSVGVPITNDNTIYYSYMADVQGDEFVIIYNDNPSNLSKDLPKKKHKPLVNPKKGVPMMVSFDSKGEMSKKLLKDVLKGEDIYLRPQMYYYNPERDSYIIYGSNGKDDKLGRMSFIR